MVTLEQLERIYAQIRESGDEDAQILVGLIRSEITRRKSAGRTPHSPHSRKEQNRLAQQRFREKNRKLRNKPK